MSKISICPKCNDILPMDARACSCGWRAEQPKAKGEIDLYCQWNDHGFSCGKRGSMSNGMNGAGPWYCSEHYWLLKGQRPSVQGPKMSYRERWYAERGLPYQPPQVGNVKDQQ